jgi:macrolide export ATP-binding/permease protein macB
LVMEIFEKLHNTGSTIIVVTHDPEVADQAERMVVLEHGKIARIEKMSRTRPVLQK